jgi:ABC-type Fe3+-hydroxamate transport system substrate-binding protein
MIIEDIRGQRFEFARPPARVVSLVPSLTETLFALGAGDAVVGITDFCIFPQGLTCPRVGGTKTPATARIRALAPDLVYVNVEENLKRHADEIATFAPVFATEPKTVDDVAALIALLGSIHQRQERAAELIAELTAAREPRIAPFTFVVPIWKKPWMWCGGDTYVSNLVESVGGVNLLRDRERYPSIDLPAVLAMKPEVVFLPDEPYAFTAADAAEIAPHPAFGHPLPAGEGTRTHSPLSAGEGTRTHSPLPAGEGMRTHSPLPLGEGGAKRRVRVVGPFPGHLFTWHGVRTIEGLRFLRRSVARPR